MSDIFLRSIAVMDTVVTIQVVQEAVDRDARAVFSARVDAAFDWFHHVEACCSRFDENSEVSQLARSSGRPIAVSDTLFQLVTFALAVATQTDGAFDPTVGRRMEVLGFDREYRSGKRVVPTIDASSPVSHRDVQLDARDKTITLLRPLVLDLGAVAKGFAVDLAARELQPLQHFAVDAGGDGYFSGHNASGEPWSVGIRHPRKPQEFIEAIAVSNAAVCTSGDYARVSPMNPKVHHIIDPSTGASADALASVTVVAPTAIVADALATAAFVLGPARGVELLQGAGVDGLLVSPSLDKYVTTGSYGCFRA